MFKFIHNVTINNYLRFYPYFLTTFPRFAPVSCKLSWSIITLKMSLLACEKYAHKWNKSNLIYSILILQSKLYKAICPISCLRIPKLFDRCWTSLNEVHSISTFLSTSPCSCMSHQPSLSYVYLFLDANVRFEISSNQISVVVVCYCGNQRH